MSLSRRFLAGASWGLIDQALKIASAFILTPIIVGALGAGPYGVWCVIIAVFAQYGWLDLGLAVSVPRFFAKAMGKNDRSEIQSLASTCRVIFSVVAVLSLVATAFVAWQAPAWFSSSADGSDATLIMGVFGSFLAVQTLCQLQLGYLKGHLCYDRIAMASICRVLLSGVLFYVFLNRGYGLVAVAVIQAGCGVMECLLLVLFARRLEPPLRPRFGDFQKNKAIELLKYSAVAYAMMAGLNLRNTLDPIIVAAQAGEAAVTGYALGNRFPVLFVDLAHILAGGQLLSLFSRFVGNDDHAGLKRAYLFASTTCATVAAFGAAMMWLFGSTFLQRWIPDQAAAAWAVMIPAVLPKALYIAQTPSMVILLAMARHRRLAVIDWVAGALNLALTWWLTGRMGAPGAAWATCAEQSFVCALIWPILGAKAAGLTFSSVWIRQLAVPILRASVVLAPCIWLRRYAEPDYLSLITLGTISCIWFVAVNILLLSDEERQWLVKFMPFLRSFVRGKKTSQNGSDQ